MDINEYTLQDLQDALEEMLNAPAIDDPLDVLNDISEFFGLGKNTYFVGRGQWVSYPQEDAPRGFR